LTCNFSKINLQYLIQARDIAKKDVERGAILLGMGYELSKELAEISPGDLALVAQVTVPLIRPHPNVVWWQRFFQALSEGRVEEAQAVMQHANLIALERFDASQQK